jgi:hypothetical protein
MKGTLLVETKIENDNIVGLHFKNSQKAKCLLLPSQASLMSPQSF